MKVGGVGAGVWAVCGVGDARREAVGGDGIAINERDLALENGGRSEKVVTGAHGDRFFESEIRNDLARSQNMAKMANIEPIL